MAGPFGGFLCQPLSYRRVSMWPQVFEVDNRFLRVLSDVSFLFPESAVRVIAVFAHAENPFKYSNEQSLVSG